MHRSIVNISRIKPYPQSTTLIHCTCESPRLNHAHSLGNRTRKIEYAFDPVSIPTEKRPSDSFSFLRPERIAFHAFQHANYITPPSVGVPWPTSFPSSLQSKYWVEVEETARAFTQEIVERRSEVKDAKYLDAIIEAAVSMVVNTVPMGNLTRTKILAKLYVFFFLSDDVVESRNRVTGIPSNDELQNGQGPEYTVYDMLAPAVLSEDAVQGKRLLSSVVAWVSAMKESAPERFLTLEDYLTYRVADFGTGAIFRSVEFACHVSLSEADIQAIAHLQSLCEKHFLLTNDLYSYAKEAIAEQKHGDPVLNVVRVVQHLMNTSVTAAKAIVRQIIWDVEHQMHHEYAHLAQNASKSQLTYVQGLIVAVAGNMFFSATCARYAQAVAESRLHA
ncbi:terpenoid synthase [Aspergillus coremiiformis]|uniref:Terpenoid synthase n=1 Tax=Aspergillus coremiiformis TaxID=138285 RepID=A0A5N6Z608_9EURO|nr:terpenoid synthase [Aspergillus coremiiformis]